MTPFRRCMQWLEGHRAQYHGQWVALLDGVFIAADANRGTLQETINTRLDARDILVAYVPPEHQPRFGDHAPRDERQALVYEWVCRTFGTPNAGVVERVLRLFEETVELAQAEGLTPERLHAVIAYVYGKPPGDAPQEVGGIGTTLLAYCAAKGISADKFELAELERVLAIDPEHFRKRHDLKAEAGIAERVEETR